MSAEHDEHAETETDTESEDGGIPLAMSTSKAASDEVDIDTGSDVTPASHGSGASSSSSANELGEMLTPSDDDFTGHGDLTAEYQQPSTIFNETFNHPMTSPFSVPEAASSTTSTPVSVSEAPHSLGASFAFPDAGFVTGDQHQHLHLTNGDSAWANQLNGLADNILLSNEVQPPGISPLHSWSVPSQTPQASTDHLPTATDNFTPVEHLEPPAGTSENETAQNVSQNPPENPAISIEPVYLIGHNEDWLGLSEDSYNIFTSDTAQENGMLHTLNQASNMVSYYDNEDLDEENNLLSVSFFLYHWKQMYIEQKPDYPSISSLANHCTKVQRPDKLTAQDADQRDYQGIHWTRFQITKQEAREVRRMTYRNLRNLGPREENYGTKAFRANFPGTVIPSSDCYFRFNEMDMSRRPDYAHFQLRHNLSATSKNAIFYTYRPPRPDISAWDAWRLSHKTIVCFNPETGTESCALDVNKRFSKEDPKISKIHTLTAGNGVLVAGSYEGMYAMKSLSADFESAPVLGEIAAGADVSTNHIQTYLDRQSGLPRAVFDSNDRTVRILDCTTSHWVACHKYPYQVNCSAISPDGRLRLLNGDGCKPIVANAETGQMLAELPGHDDFGFACDWAADGVTMATGHQDGIVKVWDARKLNQSIQTIAMEQAGCRSLQFSPLGSGKRVLVLAEPADFVHIVDAQTFESKQTIDFFGEISGISMPPDGSKLYIANADAKYGGLMEFDRSHDGSKHNKGLFQVGNLEKEHEQMVDLIVDGLHPVQWLSKIGDKVKEHMEPFMHKQGMPFVASSIIGGKIVDCNLLFSECLKRGGGQRVTATGGWANIASTFGIRAGKAVSCGRELHEYWHYNLAPYESAVPFAPNAPEWQQTTGRDVSGSVSGQIVGVRERDLDCGEEREYWRDYNDGRRKGFKIGRKSESLDWLADWEIEDDAGVNVPKGQGRGQWASRLEIDDDLLI